MHTIYNYSFATTQNMYNLNIMHTIKAMVLFIVFGYRFPE